VMHTTNAPRSPAFNKGKADEEHWFLGVWPNVHGEHPHNTPSRLDCAGNREGAHTTKQSNSTPEAHAAYCPVKNIQISRKSDSSSPPSSREGCLRGGIPKRVAEKGRPRRVAQGAT